MLKILKILGIKFTQIDKNGAIDKIGKYLQQKKQRIICTPNPEMCLIARKNNYFKKILNNSDMNICDGFGTYVFAKFFGSKVHRITGVDFFLEICKRYKTSIFLLGAKKGIAKKTAKKLAYLKNLKVAGTYSGSSDNIEKIIRKINKTDAQILFVAFGAPKQEIFIYENLKKFEKIKIAIGVGGTFDFISGNIKRAPKFIRKIGLEWLFRLIKQPSRIKRIFNATILFPFYLILDFFKKHK